MSLYSLLIFFGIIVSLWVVLIISAYFIDFRQFGIFVSYFYAIYQYQISDSSKLIERIEGLKGLVRSYLKLSVVITLTLFFTVPLVLAWNLFQFSGGLIVATPIYLYSIPEVLIILIAVFIALLLHEFGHLMAATAMGVQVKRIGIGVFLVFIGAFVDLGEESEEDGSIIIENGNNSEESKNNSEQFRMNDKEKSIRKLSILSSGVTLNIVFSLLFLILLFFVPYLYGSPGGVVVDGFSTYSPNYQPLHTGDIIVGISRINEFNQSYGKVAITSVYDLTRVLNHTPANTTLLIHLLNSDVLVKTGGDNTKSTLGIKVSNYYPNFGFLPLLPYFVTFSLIWLSNLNLAVGVYNLLPFTFTDGGKILSFLLQYVKEGFRNFLSISVQVLVLILVIGNILVSYQ